MADTDFPGPLTGPCHHVRPWPGATRLAVFFGAKDLSFGRYNFFQAGQELRAHCLFVNNGVNHWYQYGIPGLGTDGPASLRAIAGWQAALGAREVVTIGTSMGGYGAIMYGAALGARVLAFATDAALDAPHSQSARHFVAEGPPECPDLAAWLRDRPADVTLLAGERDLPDLVAAHTLVQVPGVRAQTIVGSDHIVPSHLARRSRLGPLLRDFVKGRALPEQPDAGGALLAGDYVTAGLRAFEAAQAGDWQVCADAARAALAAYPGGEAASLLLARALIKQDRPEQAIAALAGVCATRPEDIAAKALLATALRHTGALAPARQLHHQIVVQDPGAHRSHYALGLVHLAQGDLARARACVDRALRLAPGVAAYADRLERIVRRQAAAKRAAKKPLPADEAPPAGDAPLAGDAPPAEQTP